ncbi:hypothetical protein ABT024_02565 [Streptomyces sp. NPDC002812]|uniref:hypothetical protein n=1 Tax=Streptomyces sp. NPDC002812 TaxID=3154434 RepID=UPI00332D736D
MVQGSEGDWAGHAMDFAEWLYRYLTGEEMAGWASAALHPGPVLLEYLPTGPDERTHKAYGRPETREFQAKRDDVSVVSEGSGQPGVRRLR